MISTALQLEALTTLQCIMMYIPSQSLWGAIFPGCFAGLYRAALSSLGYSSSSIGGASSSSAGGRGGRASSSYKVASSCVRTIVVLLKVSLGNQNDDVSADGSCDKPCKGDDPKSRSRKEEGVKDAESIISSLMAAVEISKQQQSKVSNSGDDNDDTELEKSQKQLENLKQEVNDRLPGPLSALLGLCSTHHRASIRQSGLYLCRIILIDLRSIWTPTNLQGLGKKSLEYCLMMLDDDAKLARSSRRIVSSYKSTLGSTTWRKLQSTIILTTILELFESLPTFAKNGREIQVAHHLRLIMGYLVVSFRNSGGGRNNNNSNNKEEESLFDLQECLMGKKMRKSEIGSALGCAEAVEVVKYAFSVLFAPDVDSITCSPKIETNSSTSPNASNNEQLALYEEEANNQCRFLYLRDESTINAATTTVHLIARALGAKRCAYVMDACFAEMFESCCSQTTKGAGSDRHRMIRMEEGGFIDCRRKWSGLCVYACELLKGLCGSRNCVGGGTKSSSKLSKSNLHVLSSLASSVLPVIVSHPLWTLPTSCESDMATNALPSEAKTDNLIDNSFVQSKNHTTAAQSATMMNSNAILITGLMSFISQVGDTLGNNNMRLQLPIILFPLLERASPIGNHSFVQRAAFASLRKLSASIVGYADISSLLATNFDYLVDTISLRLRKVAREKSRMERSFFGVINVILQSVLCHRARSSSCTVENGSTSLDAAAHVEMVGQMLHSLLNHFDRQSYMTNLSIFDTVSVFRSMTTFMGASIDAYIQNNDNVVPKISDQGRDDDWFQRLDFELNMESAGYAEDGNSDDDGFEELGKDVEDDSAEEAPSDEDKHSPKDDNTDEDTDFVHEITSINSVLSRCCYLLCYANLQIQVVCCETILAGFICLGKIGAYRKKLRGESAHNPLLPAIAEFWPSINARLQSASASLASVNRLHRSDLAMRHVMATNQQEGPSRASLEILLSKLILIVSELCRGSDGFFVDRFENDAYPMIARLMQNLLPEDVNSMDVIGRPQFMCANQKHPLLLSILHCLKDTFESDCGDGLKGLIPSIGTMLFPLLSTVGPVGDATMVTVKAMLTVDCDSLWRGLHKLSGRTFPCHPLMRPGTVFAKSNVPASNGTSLISFASSNGRRNHDRMLSQKAGELLDFMEELPEQSV